MNKKGKAMDYRTLFIISLLPVISGCATLTDAGKGFAGVSTKSLEEGRKNALTRVFDCDYDACFEKVKKVLGHTGSYVYAQDKKKRMMAVYISEEDTTPVGIFFKQVEASKTQVEVSSPSTYGKELISSRLFTALENSQKRETEEKEVKTDGKEEK